MKFKNKFLIFCYLSISLVLYSSNLESVDKIAISAWIPYWDIKNSTQNLKDNFLGKISEINPFVYVLDKEANLLNASKDKTEYKDLIDAAKSNNIKIIPTITNDVFYSNSEKKLKDPSIVHRILNDKDLRKKHIQQIMDIIKEENINGIDVDYENINIEDKKIFTQFIKELYSSVHRQNKILYVTVQQKTVDHQRAGAGSVDWKEISPYADKIIIMCYPYYSKTTKPGPICPASWLKEIIKFALSQIPKEKICIAIALHGFDWSKGQATSLNLKKADSLKDKFKAKLKWDKKSHAPNFVYFAGGEKHEVWFENKQSISEKIKIIKKYKIPNIAFWHLGILEPNFLDIID